MVVHFSEVVVVMVSKTLDNDLKGQLTGLT